VGAKLILEGKAAHAFNPSGGYHHAHAEKASGFCYVNDVALACMVLEEAGRKVMYVDVDVHHGDGVAYAFYDDPRVLTVSLHQNPRTLFPGTGFEDEIGTGEGRGYCVNVPLPIGTYDAAYMHAFKEIVPPLIEAFEPDVFVFELGADALANDPLANLRLTNNTYVDVLKRLLGCGRPILMAGGGGYNVENTVRAWALAWTVLSGQYEQDDINIALGGVMLESTEWRGGLKDRALNVSSQQKEIVKPAIERVIRSIKKSVFPIHGLSTK
jgi:acetoin utilization protein AcuC